MNRKPILGNFPPYLKLMTFGLVILFSMIIVLLIGMLIAIPIFGTDAISNMSKMTETSDPSLIAMAKYFQIISQFAIFIIPSIIFAFLAGRNSMRYMKISHKPELTTLIYAGLSIIAAIPLINFLGEINQNIALPSSLAGIESWMQNSEKQAAQLTELFLNVNTIGALLINILMIGILPAIGEEFLFRGILQRLFHEWIKNIHVAIILTAFIFSFIHFQFYGFFPRFALGMVMGYLFYWSGSLWVPILVHFINNTFAVVVFYYTHLEGFGKTYETVGTSENLMWIALISSAIVSILLWKIYSICKKDKTNFPADESLQKAETAGT